MGGIERSSQRWTSAPKPLGGTWKCRPFDRLRGERWLRDGLKASCERTPPACTHGIFVCRIDERVNHAWPWLSAINGSGAGAVDTCVLKFTRSGARLSSSRSERRNARKAANVSGRRWAFVECDRCGVLPASATESRISSTDSTHRPYQCEFVTMAYTLLKASSKKYFCLIL